MDTDDSIKIESLGNLLPPLSCHLLPVPNYALHPTCLILQIEPSHLEVFPITSLCLLDTPFPIAVGHKRIIGFSFIGPTSKVTRLAVLTEEFNGDRVMRLFEIDLLNRTYTRDRQEESLQVGLPNDTYNLLSLDPEDLSIVVAFSTQQAIRIIYSAGLTPGITTATINTPNHPLLYFTHIHQALYAAADMGGRLRFAEIKEAGPVHFGDVATIDPPLSLLTLSDTHIFVPSSQGDSIFFKIDESKIPIGATPSRILHSSGPVINFGNVDPTPIFNYSFNASSSSGANKYVTICQNCIALTEHFHKITWRQKIMMPMFTSIYPILFEEKNCFILSNGFNTYTLNFDDPAVPEPLETPFNGGNTLHFVQFAPSIFAKVTAEKVSFFIDSEIKDVLSNVSILAASSIRLQKKDDLGLIAIAFCNNTEKPKKMETKVKIFDYQGRLKSTYDINVEPICSHVSALAISEDHLVVASNSTLVIFSLKYSQNMEGNEEQRIEIGPIRSLAYCKCSEASELYKETFFAVAPSEKAYAIDGKTGSYQEIFVPGTHYGIKPFVNDHMIVYGTKSTIFSTYTFKSAPLSEENLIDGCEIDGQFAALDPEFLNIGEINQMVSSESKTFIADSLISQKKFIQGVAPGILATANELFTYDYNPNAEFPFGNLQFLFNLPSPFIKFIQVPGAVVVVMKNHISLIPYETEKIETEKIETEKIETEKIETEKIDAEKMAKTGENFEKPRSGWAISEKARQNLDSVKTVDLAQEASEAGVFRDYIWLRGVKQVTFLSKNVTELFSANSIANGPKIHFFFPFDTPTAYVAFGTSIAATISESGAVAAYIYYAKGHRFENVARNPIPWGTIKPSGLAILGDTIVVSADTTLKSFTLRSSPDVVQPYELIVSASFDIGQTITKISPTEPHFDQILVGTNGGGSFVMERHDGKQRFEALYEHLIKRAHIGAGFAKWQQRAGHFGREIIPGKQMIDLEFIRDFLELNESQKRQALQSDPQVQPEFTVEQAISIIAEEHFT